MVRKPQVHDLVKLSPQAVRSLTLQPGLVDNPWVQQALEAVPWAVVRRAAPVSSSHVAIGIRGNTRTERWGTEISIDQIEDIISVYEIKGSMPADPVFEALKAFTDLPFRSGPGGSAGFELHTGWKATHRNSDLDLVIYMDTPPSGEDIKNIRQLAERASQYVRVDILVETPRGGVAFPELARAVGLVPQPSIMLRTSEGPKLVTEVWR